MENVPNIKPAVRKVFLKYAEKLGAKYSDYLIADSVAYTGTLFKKLLIKKDSEYIAYGGQLNFIIHTQAFWSQYNFREKKSSIPILRWSKSGSSIGTWKQSHLARQTKTKPAPRSETIDYREGYKRVTHKTKSSPAQDLTPSRLCCHVRAA